MFARGRRRGPSMPAGAGDRHMSIWRFDRPPVVRPVKDIKKLLLARWLGSFYLDSRDPLEAEQSIIRPLIGTVFFGWCSLFEDGTWNIPLLRLTEVFFYSGSFAIIWHIRTVPNANEYRRFLATLVDMATIFGCVLSGNRHLLVGLLAAAQFVVIGNGFRYGADHLRRSFLVALCVVLCLLARSQWRADLLTWSSLLLLLIVPMYALKFLKERNAMEADIVSRNDLLDRALATKHRLLSNVSHELNTPLFTILHLVERMRHGDARGNAGDLELLSTSARLLSDQVTSLLQLSDVHHSTGAAVQDEVFDIVETTRGMAKAIEVQASKRGIAVYLDLPEQIDGLVRGQGVAFRQIAMNLMKNAVKFTDYGHVHVELLDLGQGEVEGRRFKLVVQDTGIGISPEHLPHIWEPFYQGDQAVGRSRGGNGLGLAIARELAERVGGALSAASSPKGSAFSFEFPAFFVPPTLRASLARKASELLKTDPPLEILIADDDPLALEILVREFAAAGHQVTACSDGTSALEAIGQSGQLDLIILDRHMPGLEGPDVLRYRRTIDSSAGSQAVCVAYTADHTAEAASVGLSAGFAAVLKKGEGVRAFVPFANRAAEAKRARSGKRSDVRDQKPRWSWREIGAEDLYLRHLDAIRSAIVRFDAAVETKSSAELKSLLHRFRGQSALFGTPVIKLLNTCYGASQKIPQEGCWDEINSCWLEARAKIVVFLDARDSDIRDGALLHSGPNLMTTRDAHTSPSTSSSAASP
jgi:signal transduction histidine kinase/CheY-like chemotaxis protein